MFAPDYEEAGMPFDEHGDCVLEEFKVVFLDIPGKLFCKRLLKM